MPTRLRRHAFGGSFEIQSQNMLRKLLILSLAFAGSVFAQTTPNTPPTGSKRPFMFEDMMKLKRVGAPLPSPNGKWVVFDAVDVDLEANTKVSHLWIVPAQGGEARRLRTTRSGRDSRRTANA